MATSEMIEAAEHALFPSDGCYTITRKEIVEKALDHALSGVSETIQEWLREARDVPVRDYVEARYWDTRVGLLRDVQRLLGLSED